MTDPDDPDPDAAAIRAGLLIRHVEPTPETPKAPDEVFEEHCAAILEFLDWGARSGAVSEFGYCVLNAMRAGLEELEHGQRIDDLMRADLLRFSKTSAWFFDSSDVYDGAHPLVLAAMPAAAALVAAIDDQRSTARDLRDQLLSSLTKEQITAGVPWLSAQQQELARRIVGVQPDLAWHRDDTRLAWSPAWRPINTAPGNGGPILVARDDLVTIAWWKASAWQHRPTHWMPLPPLPSARPVVSTRADWTAKDGRTNSADEFLALGKFVGRIIRDSAHTLLSGQVDHVGHLVMAQLAHVKGLAPRSTETKDHDSVAALESEVKQLRTLVQTLKFHTEETVALELARAADVHTQVTVAEARQLAASADSIREAFETGFASGLERGHDTAQVRAEVTTHEMVREDLAVRERALKEHMTGLAERAGRR